MNYIVVLDDFSIFKFFRFRPLGNAEGWSQAELELLILFFKFK